MNWLGKVEEVRQITSLEKWVHLTLKRRYVELATLEEKLWRHRAKFRCEIKGDRNTRYFHSLATASKRTNVIPKIEHEGQHYTSQQDKARVFWNFYVQLMGKQSDTLPALRWDNLYETTHNLQELSKDVIVQEIERVINEWPSNKSPGPDEFSGEFFKEFRDVLLPDLHKVIIEVLDKGWDLDKLNTSYLVLIPKKDAAKMPKDFRPISLIHGRQKIVSKILANRLQPYMQHLVGDNQSGFIKGRQITEGFLYAQ